MRKILYFYLFLYNLYCYKVKKRVIFVHFIDVGTPACYHFLIETARSALGAQAAGMLHTPNEKEDKP